MVTIQSYGITNNYYASESKRILPSGLGCNPFVVAGFINNKMKTKINNPHWKNKHIQCKVCKKV